MSGLLIFLKGFTLLQLNHSKSYYSAPHDSTEGIPQGILLICCAIGLVLGIITFFKVRQMMNEERKANDPFRFVSKRK